MKAPLIPDFQEKFQSASPVHPEKQPQPQPARIQQLYTLHRSVGNRAVGRLLQTGSLQAKLRIGQPDDSYEREADRVATQVTGMPDKVAGNVTNGQVTIPLHMEEKEALWPARENPGYTPEVTPETAANIQTLSGKGQLLPGSVRTFFEPRFGADFSQVRVHTGAGAAKLAQAVNARAFTVGQHVVFGAGEYKPETQPGEWLLAHELVHTIQQGRRDVAGFGGVIQRIPRSEDELEGKNPRYSYSTHCGWIDWGHANPGLAKQLLDNVKQASDVMFKREKPLRIIRYDQPKLVWQEECAVEYDSKEVRESKTGLIWASQDNRSSGIVEFRVSGFEVGSADATRFLSVIKYIAAYHEKLEKRTGWPHTIIIHGFTDCIDTKKKNPELRKARAENINKLFASHGKSPYAWPATASEYMADNGTRAGRKINRGVLVELIPEIEPEHEKFYSPVMETKVLGRQLTAAYAELELNRSLSQQEIEGVALWIFQNLSMLFEREQAWTERIGRSSFSEEDLPSNLIGFYMAVMGVKPGDVRATVEPICDVWDPERSKELFEFYRFKENRTFRPPFSHWPGTWPAQFEKIFPQSPAEGMFDLLGYRLKAAMGIYICDDKGKCYED